MPKSYAKVDIYKQIADKSRNPLIFTASRQDKAAVLPSIEGTAALPAARCATSSQRSCGT